MRESTSHHNSLTAPEDSDNKTALDMLHARAAGCKSAHFAFSLELRQLQTKGFIKAPALLNVLL